jgi:hypothetical protein
MSEFHKAERRAAKIRIGLVGPAGSGKTYSALLLAAGLGGPVALIDTEAGSGELYAGSPGIPEYDVCTLEPPYTVQKYLSAIGEAEAAGYVTLVIDSLSHAWAGEGGLLDQQGKIADSGRGNSYTAWRSITPLHNRLVESILTSKCHIVATMRAKTEYVVETNDKGKQVPKKVGLAPVQREGLDYEFTLVLDLDARHNATASKDRTGLFDGQIFPITPKTGEALRRWLEGGSVAPVPSAPASPARRVEPLSPAPATTVAADPAPAAKASADDPLEKDRRRLFVLMGSKGLDWPKAEQKAFVSGRTGKDSTKLLSREELRGLIAEARGLLAKRDAAEGGAA